MTIEHDSEQGRGGDDDYGLRIEPRTPRPEPTVDLEKILCDSSDPPPEPIEEEDEAEEAPPPPKADFKQLYTGVFLFPFGLDVLAQTITLIIAAGALTAMFKTALLFGGSNVGGLGGAGVGVGSMFMCIAGGIWLVICIFPASAWGLNVLHTTSYGGEKVESWPNLLAFEGFIDVVFVVAAVLMAAVPPTIAISLSGGALPGLLLIAVSEFVLVPVLLLSTLENNMFLNPFSKAIWKSVFSELPAWGVFYGMTLLLAGLIIVVFVVSLWIGSWVNAIAVGFVVGAGWMFYFRLLGRLTRYCSLKAREELGEDNQDIDTEDDV